MTSVVVWATVLLLVSPFMLLTAVGSLRRGQGAWLALVSGLAFPVAWAAWYVRAERYPSSSRPV